MGASGSDKKGLYVIVSKETATSLRRLIAVKYREYRKGYLSSEVELALRSWIRSMNRCYNVWSEVKRFIEKKYGMSLDGGRCIPVEFLHEAVAFVRGSDPRTIKKWLKVFTEQKLIKWITPELVEVRG